MTWLDFVVDCYVDFFVVEYISREKKKMIRKSGLEFQFYHLAALRLPKQLFELPLFSFVKSDDGHAVL